MKRPRLLGEAPIPGSDKKLRLLQGKDDCTITVTRGGELMSTRKHASEDALAAIPCSMLADTRSATILIGGLGMGFTLAAALQATGTTAQITVAELVPEVIEWNKGPLGAYAGYPLNDPRCSVYPGDVIDLLRDPNQRFDVIALDVDNGPEGFSSASNNWIYSNSGIDATRQSLNQGGLAAYWSASADKQFPERLQRNNMVVQEHLVLAHGKKGPLHTIWIASAHG